MKDRFGFLVLSCAVLLICGLLSSSALGVDYYVNDGTMDGTELYTTAVGSGVNTGLSGADPMDGIGRVLSAYDLGPGDVVYVDVGTYNLASNIIVTSADGGDAASPVTIYGAGWATTCIDRNLQEVGNEYCFEFAENAAYYVVIRDMEITNGDSGIQISGGASNIDIYYNHIWGNQSDGIYANVAANLTIGKNKIHCNSMYGIRLLSVNTASIYNNIVYSEDTNEVYLGTGSGSQSQSINFYNNSLYHVSTPVSSLYADDVNGLTLTNNIIQQTAGSTGSQVMNITDTATPSLTSNYNNFYGGMDYIYYNASAYTNLTLWQAAAISPDANSISSDPLFVDEDGDDNSLGGGAGKDDDFHIQSMYESYHVTGGWTGTDAATSPSIDAGDPASTYTTEPGPSGIAINQGAYGNLAQASKTPNQWYFVNDATYNAAEDLYSSAAGNSGNSGLKPNLPLDSIADVISNYALTPGDVIWIDTGTYTAPFAFNNNAEAGSATFPIRVVGSTSNNYRGSVVTGSVASYVSTNYVHVENLVFTGSADHGIAVTGTSGICDPLIGVEIRDCTTWGNSGIGIDINGSSATIQSFVVEGCTSYSNTYGIMAEGYFSSGIIDGNLVYGNSSAQIYAGTLYASGGTVTIEGNTCYNNASSHGIWLSSIENLTATVKNNIAWIAAASGYPIYKQTTNVTYSGDYNNWYASGGTVVGNWETVDQSTLADWQTASSGDANSISGDPLFVDPAGADATMGESSGADDDFHLQSTAGSYTSGSWTADAADSPSIDAGNPASTYSNETAPNGSRVNQGFYGNCGEASRSAAAASPIPTPTVVSPTYGTDAGGTALVITGTDFTASDTVTVGGVSCTGVTFVSATSLTCTTGAGSAGMSDLVVTNANGSGTLSNAFLYYSTTSDYDSDGMPDAWEVTYSLSLTTDDSAVDTDGDGRTNLQEYTDGTDPTDAASVIDTTPPACPMTILVVSDTTSVTLVWPASTASDTAGYKIYTSTDGGTTWDAGVDAGSVLTYTITSLTNGATYTFKITAYDEMPNESSGISLDVVVGAGAITVSTDITAGNTAASYRMISFPVVPGSDLFTELQNQLGTYDPAIWRLFRYSSGSYAESSSAGTVMPGYSYWILSTVPMSLSFAGGVVTDSFSYPILIKPGWNQIANPFRNSVDWTTVYVYDPSTATSILVTDSGNTLTSSNYWVYSSSGYTASTTMIPFEGGWLYSYASGDLQLLIPAPPAGAKPSIGPSTGEIIRPASAKETPPSPPGYNLASGAEGGGGCFLSVGTYYKACGKGINR